MTAPRFTKIDLSFTPFYHCMTRCVRRTYLCGKDEQTGQDFEHRKGWIVARIKQLSQIFAIKICAYAVMSNHYHVVLFVNEIQAKDWSEREVIERWSALFPNDAANFINSALSQKEIDLKITQWRERLLSISWFMRCINETIAKFANLEDDCKGRFWEGRFKSQALLDEGAVLAAMVYVDLNPIRSKTALTPEESEFTSVYERIKEVAKSLENKSSTLKKQSKMSFNEVVTNICDAAKQPKNLMAFANNEAKEGVQGVPKIDFRLSDYLQLIDTTGRIIREDKKGAIPENLSPILTRLNLTTAGWLDMVQNLEHDFYHAVGQIMVLAEFGSQYRKRLPNGITAAKRCYLKVA